jgi:resuscitation-promoting factor RpfB
MNRRRAVSRLYILLCIALLAQFLAGCQGSPTEKNVTVVVDGRRLTLSTAAFTVRELLTELEIEIGALDRVEPDMWQDIVDGGMITIRRVEIHEEIETRTIAFEQKTIKSEAMAVGDRKLLQLGSAGAEEIVYRVIIEDGEEAERIEVLRRVTRPPVDEIIAVGVESNLASVPISGAIAYISGGNAWIMRETSASRRPLTASGDLDGRVFALSPDGDWLIYSRVLADAGKQSLNSLWIIGTSILNETPQALGIEDVIYAQWFSDSRRIIYSSAERIDGAPGWKAHNDLWQARLSGMKPAGQRTGDETIKATSRLQIEPSDGESYSWWGTTFALSPDGRRVAYGRPDAVGILDLQTGADLVLLDFAVYHTYGDWVWLPELAWSPDGEFIVCSAHGVVVGSATPEDSPVFDIWIVDRTGELRMKILDEAGMWAEPEWSPAAADAADPGESWITYGKARIPRDSQNSRYDLYVMDRDGSNRRKIFPPAGREGLVAPDLSWSPDARRLVIAYEGNLYMIDVAANQWVQVTADGHSGQPRWRG